MPSFQCAGCRRHSALSLALATLAIAAVASAAPVSAQDWSQFRGPNASGVAENARDLPVEFSTTKNVAWSRELGLGIACPVIAGGRCFATSLAGEELFGIYCLDALTGEELWKKELKTGPLPDIMPPNEHASSTPVSDGERVYVYFSTLGMMAFDAATGKELWTRPVQMPFYLMGWGAAHSPILHGDLLIFNQDDDLDPFLMAIDKYTGKVRWRTPRPEMLGGYSTPVLCTANGRTDVVVAGTGKMKGYDPETGKELWTCNSLLRTIMTTPVVVGDRIFISVQSYGDTARVLKYALLQWKDTNQDGKLEKSELAKAFWAKFDKGDGDGDGFLVDDEIDAAFQAPTNMVGGGNIIQAIRGGGTGDVTKTHLVWNVDSRAPSNISSPLAIGDQLFLVRKGGISASFSTEDGSPVWKRLRIRNLGNYYASPIAGDGKIYVAGENGFIVVLKQGAKPQILSRNDLRDSIVATPAIAENGLYVRTLRHMYCFRQGAGDNAAAASDASGN